MLTSSRGQRVALTRKKPKSVSVKIEPYLYLIPALLAAFCFTYLPFVRTIGDSFFFINTMGERGQFAGITNYKDVFSHPLFFKSLLNTLEYAVLIVPGSIIISLIFALMADKKRRFSKIYFTLFALPMAISVSAAAMIFKLIMNPTIGVLNYIFKFNIGWFGDPKYALLGISIMVIWLKTGFEFIFLSAALKEVPNDLIENADLAGANFFQKTIYITIPMISPTIFFLFCTELVNVLMISSPIIILTQGGPRDSTSSLLYYMYSSAYDSANYGYAYALSTILFIISSFLLVLTFKFEKKGVFYS